ncbi:energy transducer TonB [uncultured Fusobacterium sp.]|jgi:TonB family protein|uniref:energy transducer TonB n=1 Tax=uncultured Fusobacterium sp. TaxID=159267 RepID=UPI0025F867DB|nr:energy transducer TonB [uncultured Fusobacterium sp.]
MKKTDYVSLGLSVLINLLILLVIPGLSVETIVDKKIKVGLVAYDNNKSLKMEGKKNSNTKTKNMTTEPQKQTSKKEVQKEIKKEIINKNDTSAQIKKQETVVKEKKKPTLSDIAKNISGPEIDVLSSISNPVLSKKNKSKSETKKIETLKEDITTSGLAKENIDISTGNSELKDEKFMATDEKKLSFNSEEGNDLEFERILKAEGDAEGLPSGYRLGTEDGNIVARWDNSNMEPVYPESAQLKGLHGTVRIRMNIDEYGNVTSLFLEKGSGVPEINSAIEEIGRTWKIYLSKNGMNVKGDVILEYNFTLRGKN